MGSFIAIGLPEDFTKKYMDFCNLLGYETAEPYISLVESSLLENIGGLERKLQSFCLGQADFSVMIGGPGTIKDTLLYLSVLPGDITSVRNKLVSYLKIDSRNKVFKPYLTVMLQHEGNNVNIPRAAETAKQVFGKPYVFKAESFVLYAQQKDTGLYKPSKTIAFSGR